jgi:hypothetical protein
MRYVLCWLLLALFSTTCCLSQTPDTAIVGIPRLPPGGLLLAKGWHYHAGDNHASGRAVLAIHEGVEGVFADPVRVLQAWKRQETRLNNVAAIQLRHQLVTKLSPNCALILNS